MPTAPSCPAGRSRSCPTASTARASCATAARPTSRGRRSRLVFIGRLAREKGVFETLQAMRLAREAGVDARLLVAGGGPDEPGLRQRMHELALEREVTFVGPCSTSRARRGSSAAATCSCCRATARDCRTRCSRRWRRVPCRSSRRVGAIPDVVIEGRHGLSRAARATRKRSPGPSACSPRTASFADDCACATPAAGDVAAAILDRPRRGRASRALYSDACSRAMCGIAGWVAAPRSAPEDAAIAAALDAIAHRGPDGEGASAFVNRGTGARVVLGHRRLAIIDPQGARQPMCDDAAGLALTFNGEIYNFRELRAQLAGARLPLRARLRHRGAAARLPALGRGRGRPPARHVRLRGVGRRAASACCSRATASARSRSSCCEDATARSTSPPRSRRCSPCRRHRAGGGPARGVGLPRLSLRARAAHALRAASASCRPATCGHVAVRPPHGVGATGSPPDRELEHCRKRRTACGGRVRRALDESGEAADGERRALRRVPLRRPRLVARSWR